MIELVPKNMTPNYLWLILFQMLVHNWIKKHKKEHNKKHMLIYLAIPNKSIGRINVGVR